MRVNGVILPTNTLAPLWSSDSLALQTMGHRCFLDWQLAELRKLFKDPIVILGPDGDDLLRSSPQLGDRRMVFTRKTPATLSEQIQTGLQGAGTCAFFLPLHVPVPMPNVWTELEKALAQTPYNSGPHILRPDLDGRLGFPLLITPRGKDFIEDLEDQTDLLSHPEIEITPVKIRSETALQELKSIEHFLEWKSLFAP